MNYCYSIINIIIIKKQVFITQRLTDSSSHHTVQQTAQQVADLNTGYIVVSIHSPNTHTPPPPPPKPTYAHSLVHFWTLLTSCG